MSHIHTHTYPNNFRIVYEKSPSHSVPISAIQLFVDFGSIHESDEEHTRGIAHFMEHMVFKGTKKYPESKQIFSQFDRMGAKVNAYTVKRYTCYTIEVQDEFMTNALEILSEMLLQSLMNPEHMKREEQVVLEENIKNIKDPDQILEDGKDSLLYQGTPYEYPIDNISYHKHAYKPKEIKKWYKSIYQPHCMIISIVSNQSFSSLCTLIQNTDFVQTSPGAKHPLKLVVEGLQPSYQRAFAQPSFQQLSLITNNHPVHSYSSGLLASQCRPSEYDTKIPALLPSLRPRLALSPNKSPLLMYKPDLTTFFVTLSFPTCTYTSSDRHALNFLKIILGGHFSSRMFMILREQHGLTYNSYVSTQYNEYGGDFSLCVECDSSRFFNDDHGANRKQKSLSIGGLSSPITKKLGVLPLLVKLLRDIQKKGNITLSEMEQNKSYIRGMLSLNMNSNKTYAEHNGQQCLLYASRGRSEGSNADVSYRDIYSTYYEPLTIDDMERVIKQYLHLDKMLITMVGTKLPTKKQIDFILS